MFFLLLFASRDARPKLECEMADWENTIVEYFSNFITTEQLCVEKYSFTA